MLSISVRFSFRLSFQFSIFTIDYVSKRYMLILIMQDVFNLYRILRRRGKYYNSV